MKSITVRAALIALLGCFALLGCSQGGNLGQGTSEPNEAPQRTVPTVATLQKGQGPQRQALPVAASASENAALIAQHPDLAAFLAGEGKGWTVSFDRRSGQPMLLQGSGIPWLPGAGNDLDEGATYGQTFLAMPQDDRLLAITGRTESRARSLLAARPALLGRFSTADLVLDRRWTGSPDEAGQLVYATFRHAPNGIEQHDARLTFVVSHGNLVQIHAERVVQADLAEPRLTPSAAFARLVWDAEVPAGVKPLDQELRHVLLAPRAGAPGVYDGALGHGYEQRLAYQFRFEVEGDTKTFAAWVDAQTGETLELFDDNKYAGVTGGVFPRTSGTAEILVPFVDTNVTNSTTKVTDLGGNFSYAGGTASSSLNGPHMGLSDSCGAPAASSSTGDVSLGTSTGTDCTFSTAGHTTRAGRNAVYHLNNVRRMGVKHLQGFNTTASNWMSTNVGVNVNLAQTCNAYWNGSTVNFFRSGGGCNNTGEISDVMQHEWGHGLDRNTKGGSVGDSAKGEAVADTVAILMTHDSCIGPNFLQSGGGETTYCSTGVRDLAFVVTQANIASVCPTSTTCAGALGRECHCESHLLSGAHWKLAQLFVQRYGEHEGWNRFERGFLRALPNITAYLPGTAGNAYDAWMGADDDNGNLTDGTPNADIIWQAFDAQGLAGTQRTRAAAACPLTPPAGPAVTATGGASSVALSWGAVSGATSYAIYRTQGHNDGKGFLPLASGVTATSYSDTQVRAGYSYSYQVVALTGSCASAYAASPATATPSGSTASDFALSLSPSTISVLVGGAATVTVSTTVVSGSPGTVTLSVSGLPSGVTGSFNPASVAAGQSSTLTLTAASSAPPASATYTVTGTAGTLTRTANGTVTVSGGSGNTTTLSNGVAVTNLSGATGASQYFVLAVPAGASSLSFVISGGTGDADLYVKSGALPTTSSYDCRPYLSGNSETCSFTAPAAGNWYVMLRAYASYSGVSLKGTYVASTDTTPALANGVAVTNISGASGSQQYWKLSVPAGQAKVVFTISGGTGDADMYVRIGAKPTLSTYACRPYLNGNNETCTFNAPAAGDYYVMLNGYTSYSGVSLKGQYP